MAVQYMRRVIEKKAKFDIMNLNCLQVTPKTFIPALFGHANCDKFVQPHHSEFIYNSYAGDKNIIKFDGDHNSSRPQFYYDSVSIFFYNVLHPPQLPSAHASKLEKYYDLGDLKIGADMDENLIYEIISSLRSTGNDVAGSSSAPIVPTTKFVGDLISEIPPVITDIDTMPNDYSTINSDEPSHLQEQPNDETEECCSYTSSNRESWGRCSSLGASDEESSAACVVSKNKFQETLEAFPTPLRSTQEKPSDSSKDDKKKKKKVATSPKQKKSKTEKLEALSRHLRLCILRRVHR